MRSLTILSLSLSVAVLGCSYGNDSGRFTATKLGDLALVPAPRVPFDDAMVAACGPMAAAPDPRLTRRPYLQRLSADEVTIVWTATTPDPITVEVTRPDGSPVTDVVSSIEPTRYLGAASQHLARIDGLEAGAHYCYRLRAGDEAWTPAMGFRTAPAPGSGEEISFVAFGDSGGGGADQRAVVQQMQTTPFDFFLITGDIAYDHGTLSQLERSYFAVYEPIIRHFAAFPVAGNHDYHTDDAAPFREVFVLPDNGGEEGLERWFSFDWGDVHFVALDTEQVGPAQEAWLAEDLEANELPWVIVYAHRGPYSSGQHGNFPAFSERFGPILARHRVPLVLSGHDHNYERTIPMEGTTYVVTGGGGRGTRSVGTSSFTAFSEDVLHFVWVQIQGSSLRLHAIDGGGKEFDSAVIEL